MSRPWNLYFDGSHHKLSSKEAAKTSGMPSPFWDWAASPVCIRCHWPKGTHPAESGRSLCSFCAKHSSRKAVTA